MADTQLILHVKGTEETTSLPKQKVRADIAQGRITYSQLIWSPLHEAWKQVRELPDLWPSQKLAPSPAPRIAMSAPVPRVAAPEAKPLVPKPQVAHVPTPRVQAQPQVAPAPDKPRVAPRVQAASVPVAVPRAAVSAASSSHVVEEEDEAGPRLAKWICIGVGSLVALALAGNYFKVDQPLVSQLSQTSFSKVSVYGHLGALVQTGDLVIHVPGSSALNESNFAGFLVALAHSTPPRPLGGGVFDRVSLTSGWTGRYSFDGEAWKELGQMDRQDDLARKNFILDQLDNASGQLEAGTTTDPGVREKVWEKFVRDFVRS